MTNTRVVGIPVTLRPNMPADEAFILNSWLRSYQDTPDMRWLPGGTFYRGQHDKFEEALREQGATVACQPDDLDQILGWMVRDKDRANVIHYVYVKQPWRKLGIAAALLHHRQLKPGQPIFCTHWSESCEFIALKHPLLHAASLMPKIPTEAMSDLRSSAPWSSGSRKSVAGGPR